MSLLGITIAAREDAGITVGAIHKELMDLAFFMRNRLKQLRLGPRDRARASAMAEFYVAQHHTPSRPIHIQDQVERVLQLPPGQLTKVAHLRWGTPEKAGGPPLAHRPGVSKLLQANQDGGLAEYSDE